MVLIKVFIVIMEKAIAVSSRKIEKERVRKRYEAIVFIA